MQNFTHCLQICAINKTKAKFSDIEMLFIHRQLVAHPHNDSIIVMLSSTVLPHLKMLNDIKRINFQFAIITVQIF